MFDMHSLALRSDEQVWEDFQAASNNSDDDEGALEMWLCFCQITPEALLPHYISARPEGNGPGQGKPCFVGTMKSGEQANRLYEEAQKEHGLHLFANHCYAVVGAYVDDDGDRYVSIRNPHNRSNVESMAERQAKAAKALKSDTKKGIASPKGKALQRAGTVKAPGRIHRMSTALPTPKGKGQKVCMYVHVRSGHPRGLASD